jgi:hypothetical protein
LIPPSTAATCKTRCVGPSPPAAALAAETVDHAEWVVTLLSPEEETFYGRTLEDAPAWCLVWLMAPEIGVGPLLACTLAPISRLTFGKQV